MNHDDSGPPAPFAPVPAKLRHACHGPCRRDGWTIARQARFLKVLAATKNVAMAARAAGMSRESAHRLRKRDAHGLFAAMWDLCFALPPTARELMEVDQRHRRAIALGGIPLGVQPPRTRETSSTS